MGIKSTELGGTQKAVFLVLCMLLAIAPLSNVSAEDIGPPTSLQAQDINAIFDPLSETTSITWRNIDSTGTELQGLFDTTYNVYRSSEPIDSVNILNLTAFASVSACTPVSLNPISTNPFDCRGINGTHSGHSVSYLVSPGFNSSTYYAITTANETGVETYELDFNASNLFEPVSEITTPVRTPYNLASSFDSSQSKTTLQWVNYNDIFPILPETGDNAYQINIWRTDSQVLRSNAQVLLGQETPVLTLPAGTSSVVIDIPENTDRVVYYSVTYLLPNWTAPGIAYEDIRFLSNNAMPTSTLEDNKPPSQVDSMYASFTANPETGDGTTSIQWSDVNGEEGESYQIYMAGVPFSTILNSDVQLIATITEGVGSFYYDVPVGRMGHAYYCIVTVDIYGVSDTNTTQNSCEGPIFENAFTNWIAEPTNVYAVFIGDKTTRVTWDDQLGVEGERYHVWRSNYLVSGGQFNGEIGSTSDNYSVNWLGTVSDGVSTFDTIIEDDIIRDNSHYFVTSEALYGHINGTYHYTELIQNYYGPISEDTRAPNPSRIKEAYAVGSINQITLEWFNEVEVNESYTIWRHMGEPFGEERDELSNSAAEGWELVVDNINAGTSLQSSFIRQIPIDDSISRDVWYAITIADQFNNENNEIFSGIGGNAYQVTEDTMPPQAILNIITDEGEEFTSPSLVEGSYTILLQLNEYLKSQPYINITTTTGGDITVGESPMSMMVENYNNPDLGPVYSFDFEITAQTNAGPMVITVTMTDISENEAIIEWTDKAVDAQRPEVTIYSPSSSNDGSKYLYGNKINILAGAQDDVRIVSFQYKLVYHYGGVSGNALSTPWSDVDEITDLNGDNTSLTMDLDLTSGSFSPGQHAVSVRAIDSAGNEVTKTVQFIVDYCRNTLNGTTYCSYEEQLAPPLEPLVIEPGFTDPPYVVVWVIASLTIVAWIVALMVISTGMSGPKKKKKKGDDEGEDEDWMSEFIGTSSELDMAEITDVSAPEDDEKSEPQAVEEEEDDPFAVNKTQRKTRSKKSEVVDDDDDDDDDDIDIDDFFDDDDEIILDEEPKPKRSVGRRAVQPRKAPKRKVGRKSKD
ncbi:MAG: hypothetical protein QMC52_05265 [Candidatus Poseidoniaceae archaeon]